MRSTIQTSGLFLASSLLGLSAARSVQLRDTPVPLNPPSFDNWKYKGCYSDIQSSRTLAIAAHWGEHVDDDNCVYQCIQLGHIFAGIEYGGQCYCGDYVNPIAGAIDESDCYMPCTKTATQACGGPNAITLYYLDGATPVAPPAAVVTNAGPDGWVSEGCWSDSTADRTLAHRVDTTGGTSGLSIALCVDACNAAGYTLAGAEYGGECYCDNTYANGALLADQTKCNMPCNGKISEYCGGPGAMNFYSYGGATPVGVAPPAATSVTPVTNIPLPSAWATLGCFTDNVGARALAHGMNVPSLTVDKCVSACASAGYTIAGVEYGGECYCDNAIQNGQGQAPDGSVGCNMGCSGNAGEMCGGSNRMNVYAAGPAWVSIGCYTDQVYERTLTTLGAYDGLLTISKCQASCKAAGFAYAGMEYHNECHCGNSFSNGGAIAPDGSAGCSMTCDGDSTQICGGSNRLSMYEFINADGTVVAPAAASSTASSTIVSTPTPTPTPSTAAAPTDIPTGWAYKGCWTDQAHGRILANGQPDSTTNTIESCITTCAGLGYAIAGLEYSSQCFCDNYIQNQGALASSDGQCAMKCSGNSGEVCGGPNLVSLYATAEPAAAPVAAVKKTNLPATSDGKTWSYAGCYSDQDGNRDVGEPAAGALELENFTGNSADWCLTQCASKGYDAASTEYSKQCFCGYQSLWPSNPAPTLLDDSQCNMVCTGDDTQLCGGAGTTSFYRLSAPSGT